MNFKILLLLFIVSTACKQQQNNKPEPTLIKQENTKLVPADIVETTDTALKRVNGIWMYKGLLFNGYVIEKQNKKLIAKLPVIEGKEEGIGFEWYANGKLKTESHFEKGKREGWYKGWHENDTLAFVQFFKDDKYEGEQRTYFPSGHIWQFLNYRNGYEEGKQKTWNDSGRVVNNFTVKNKKLYGVIGRYDCMQVTKK